MSELFTQINNKYLGNGNSESYKPPEIWNQYIYGRHRQTNYPRSIYWLFIIIFYLTY